MLHIGTETTDQRIELPITCRRANAYFAAFPGRLGALEELMPHADTSIRPIP